MTLSLAFDLGRTIQRNFAHHGFGMDLRSWPCAPVRHTVHAAEMRPMKQSAISGVTKVCSNIILPPDFVILDLGPRSGFRDRPPPLDPHPVDPFGIASPPKEFLTLNGMIAGLSCRVFDAVRAHVRPLP